MVEIQVNWTGRKVRAKCLVCEKKTHWARRDDARDMRGVRLWAGFHETLGRVQDGPH